MKVLMITGDKKFGPGHPRFDLQASTVEELAVVYWGRGSIWPKIPTGQFDVVTAQDPLLRGAFALRAAKKVEARLNVQVHMDLQALPWWKYMLARIVLHRASSVRVVSEKIKQQVEGMGVHAPITVLSVFVDIERFKNLEHRAHSQKTILWIGRFEDEKDPLAAIEVFKEVQKTVDAKLVMLGQGSLEPQLRAWAGEAVPSGEVHLATEGTASRALLIEFSGWQDPLPYLEVADVVLCTSKHESWGASIVEALAAGVPVVAPDVGVAREAGAIVVEYSKLAGAVVDVLKNNARGELKLHLPTQTEWAERWRSSLIGSRVKA